MTLTEAAPPGGRLLYLAKLGAEQALWARVRAQGVWAKRTGSSRPLPSPVPPNDVLDSDAVCLVVETGCQYFSPVAFP